MTYFYTSCYLGEGLR